MSQVEILEDPSRQLTINDVASPAWNSAFVASHDELPTPGLPTPPSGCGFVCETTHHKQVNGIWS